MFRGERGRPIGNQATLERLVAGWMASYMGAAWVFFKRGAGCDGVTQGQVFAESDCVICLVRSV